MAFLFFRGEELTDMKAIQLNAYAKINLSLEITGRRENGYHDIDSIMQGIDLCDLITVGSYDASDCSMAKRICECRGCEIYLASEVKGMPFDESNLAIKGAKAVLDNLFPEDGIQEKIRKILITIEKRLPIAAGIAGGSGNAAAVMLGLNALLGYPMSLKALLNIGTKVGADVPFSLTMNAARNRDRLADLKGIEKASVSARATGIGEVLEPISPIKKSIIMINPGIGVSTAEVYREIDKLGVRPTIKEIFYNRMEEYTLKQYPKAQALKEQMKENLMADVILMSGSGPTMVAYYDDEETAIADYEVIDKWLDKNSRAWISKTGEE